MEITKIRRHGSEINVIFTGAQYIFHNSFSGILAVAERKVFNVDKALTSFTVYYGNHQTTDSLFDGKYCFDMAKSLIIKNENRYVKTDVIFTPVEEDLDTWYMDFKAKRR